jgi:hypothetical protein
MKKQNIKKTGNEPTGAGIGHMPPSHPSSVAETSQNETRNTKSPQKRQPPDTSPKHLKGSIPNNRHRTSKPTPSMFCVHFWSQNL